MKITINYLDESSITVESIVADIVRVERLKGTSWADEHPAEYGITTAYFALRRCGELAPNVDLDTWMDQIVDFSADDGGPNGDDADPPEPPST